MTDAERKALLQKIRASTEAAKAMSADEARKRLIDEGLYTKSGRLSVRYGGKVAARA